MGIIYSNGIYYSGPPGRGIRSITQNQDSSITIEMTDGSTWTSDSLQGPPGTSGVGITSIEVDDDGSFIFSFNDGTEYRSDPFNVNALPDVSSVDAGKIMRVDSSGNWGLSDLDALPYVNALDEGKILIVNSLGYWEVSEYDPLPEVTSADYGKALYVNEEGVFEPGYQDPDMWVKYTENDSGDDSAGSVTVIHTMLPDVDASDSGKFLMVGPDGKWTIGALSDGSGVQF